MKYPRPETVQLVRTSLLMMHYKEGSVIWRTSLNQGGVGTPLFKLEETIAYNLICINLSR